MIRPYTANDRHVCLQIFKSNGEDYFDISELVDFEVWLDGEDHQKLAYSNTAIEAYYVIERNDQVVGCGGYYIVQNEQRAKLAWGIIHQNYHKQGLGKQLFLYRFNEIRKRFPAHKIFLDTSQHTYQFFEQFDFIVINTTPDGFGVGIDKYEMVFNHQEQESGL